MPPHKLLCLRCRETGHALSQCFNTLVFESELLWMFSYERMSMDFESAWRTTDHVICERCRELDLLAILNSRPPWKTQSELTQAFQDGHAMMRNLGTIGSIEFLADCAVCRCLFAMTPNPSSEEQQVLLFPDWNLNRLAGEDGTAMDSEMKRKSATCLIIALKPSSLDLPVPIVAHRGDALCLMDQSLESGRVLGGRRIDRGHGVASSTGTANLSTRLDFVRSCIKLCANRHSDACRPVRTQQLEGIRLLDVKARKVVRYPKHGMEYVALSYVWGPITQRFFDTGDELGQEKLPKSIEDAIWFTQQLGKQYLWVDSICINQGNNKDKEDQIGRMWSIYRGAVLTLLVLPCESAYGGIPGISRNCNVSQLTCCIDGKRLVGLMPTLSQQLWVTPWAQRAWTLQEAILSPRCLYFSDHQLHFECKAMQCCESLDETSSPCHQSTTASKPENTSFVLWMAQQLGPGCLRIDAHEGRIEHYGRKLTLYSYRTMTDPRDSLNAFQGVLQKMEEEMYPKGWYEGLPVEDFDWALLWRHQSPAARRKAFPSWSWAGWQGRLWHGRPGDVTKPRRFPIPLSIHKMEAGRLIPVFETVIESSVSSQTLSIHLVNDAVHKAWKQAPARPVSRSGLPSEAERDRYLFMDAVVFNFAPDFSKPLRWTKSAGQEAVFSFILKGVQCVIGIMSLDREIMHRPKNAVRPFVLIARDHSRGMIIHHLLRVASLGEDGIYERLATIQLGVPLDQLEVLEELRLERRRLILA